MKKLFAAAACAAALCTAGAGHAAVLNFNDPGLIAIGDDGTETYIESGFMFSAPAVSFLTLDAAFIGNVDGANSPIGFMAVGGGAFSLASFDSSFYDLGLGDTPGMLSVTGLRNGVQVASQRFALGSSATGTSFGAAFGNLTAVTFSGTTAFALDNVNASLVAAPVPEPATVALTAVGLLGLMLRVNRRHKGARTSA